MAYDIYDMAPDGDYRRCPRHPGVKTSSPDGLHDTPCHMCEGEMDDLAGEEDAHYNEIASAMELERLSRACGWRVT